MAFRVVGVGDRPHHLVFDRQAPTATGKRRIIYIEEDIIADRVPGDDGNEYPPDRPLKRERRESFSLDIRWYTQDMVVPLLQGEATDDMPEFWTVPAARPAPDPIAGIGMERTASGHSISDDPADPHRSAYTELLEDAAAAQRVRNHMAASRRRGGNPDSKLHERVLRNIISPKSAAAAYPLDNAALESIFLAANELFFHGRLSQRVTWDWSHASSAHYDGSVVGTTALRRAGSGRKGFETLIVLSSPILRDGRYSRRLLISTFLHELIHSYLFICCGFRARHCGGHTPGFRTIARVVDEWAGPDSFLYLSRMEADLSCFRAEEADDALDPPFEASRGDSPPNERDYDQGEPGHGYHNYQHHHLHGQDHVGYSGGGRDQQRQTVSVPAPYVDQQPAQQWPDAGVAHSAPPHDRLRQVLYFDAEEQSGRPRPPYV